MPRRNVLALLALAAAPVAAETAEAPMHTSVESPQAEKRIVYPQSSRVEQVDDYHGVKVADPYRWLEDLDSEQTRAWVEAQNKVTSAYLAAHPRARADPQAADRALELRALRRARPAGRALLLHPQRRPAEPERPLPRRRPWTASPRSSSIPTRCPQDGTVALSGVSVSEDGKLLAYGLSSGRLRLAGVAGARRRDRPRPAGPPALGEVLPAPPGPTTARASSTAATTSRKEGRPLEEANFYQKLYYHRLGTPQSADGWSTSGPTRRRWASSPPVTEDGRYLVIHVWKGTETENGIFYKDLADARLAGRRAARRLRRRLRLRRQRRPGLLVPDRPRRAARPGGRDRPAQPGAASTGASSSPRPPRPSQGVSLPERHLRRPCT